MSVDLMSCLTLTTGNISLAFETYH